jgi:hypothetical protein
MVSPRRRSVNKKPAPGPRMIFKRDGQEVRPTLRRFDDGAEYLDLAAAAAASGRSGLSLLLDWRATWHGIVPPEQFQEMLKTDVPALVVRQPWAWLIATGRKTTEVRAWSTSYRGPLLIVSGTRAAPGMHQMSRGLVRGMAVAVAELTDVRPMGVHDCVNALAFDGVPDGAKAWVLGAVSQISSFPVRGRLGLFRIGAHGRRRVRG